jgi:peptidoglycan/xylan/chitin deacetylase (PgdA/CDA1 family)
MNAGLPLASISVNLSNHWAYLKVRGDASWRWLPTYLPAVIPRVLDFVEKHQLKATFFVVGQDAAMREHRDALQTIAAAGHEIGNHSFHYEPWLHLYRPSELHAELVRCEEQIHEVTGAAVKGFRGPSFSISHALLDLLAQRGYEYDSSSAPSFAGPIVRASFLRGAVLSVEQRYERENLFGSWRNAFRPVEPFIWRLGGPQLLEMPLTTTPGLRLPMDLTTLLHLAAVSHPLAQAYLRGALAMCSAASLEPSVLLRAVDFLEPGETKGLEFLRLPGLGLEGKMALADGLIARMKSRYRIVTMQEHAQAVWQRGGLLRIFPNYQLP